jgi:glycosyltransferase involved in cell wall biosynthesis
MPPTEIHPQPLVTIGLTTFNAINTIERALFSALNQNWRPIEVVVVDDCSSDGTGDLLRALATRHPELRLFFNDSNGGVAVSRNRILAESRGDFVAFFDDDDESLSERVIVQLNRIIEYEKRFADGAPVICHTARKLIYPNGEVREERTMGQAESKRAPAGPAVARRILIGAPLEDGYGACPTCSQMARLSTYRLIGGFDPLLRRGEDTDFNIRLALAGGHFVGIANPLVIQTMTKTSDKNLQDEYRNMWRLLENHSDFLKQEGHYEFCCEWLDAKQAWFERKRIEFLIRYVRLFLTRPFQTLRRLYMALPNIGVNRAFSRFHASDCKLKSP